MPILPSIPKLADYDSGVRGAAAAAVGGGPIAFGASLGTPVIDNDNQTTTIAISSVTVPSGSRVVVNVNWYNAAITCTVTGGGLTWTQERTLDGTASANRHIGQYSAHAASGLAGATITATFSGNAFGRAIQGFYATGINTGTSAKDVSAAAATASGASPLNWSSGSVSTTVANTLIAGFMWYEGSGQSNTPVTDTEITDTTGGFGGTWAQQYRIISSTGSHACAGAIPASAGGEVLGLMVAYKMS